MIKVDFYSVHFRHNDQAPPKWQALSGGVFGQNTPDQNLSSTLYGVYLDWNPNWSPKHLKYTWKVCCSKVDNVFTALSLEKHSSRICILVGVFSHKVGYPDIYLNCVCQFWFDQLRYVSTQQQTNATGEHLHRFVSSRNLTKSNLTTHSLELHFTTVWHL